jgi:hypothetical protein
MVEKEQDNAIMDFIHFKMNKHYFQIKIIEKHIFTILAVILIILKSMTLILIFNHF